MFISVYLQSTVGVSGSSEFSMEYSYRDTACERKHRDYLYEEDWTPDSNSGYASTDPISSVLTFLIPKLV